MQGKVVFLLLALAKFTLQDDPLVQLPTGQVLGFEGTTSEDRSYVGFEGIPYGAPPVGELRFKAPQPAENWEGVLDATSNNVGCYSLAMNMGRMPNPTSESEDCLLVNVYSPALPTSENDDLLPVMLFIHGGGFTGGGRGDAKPDLFINNDVVLVSVSYRLGPFGFLSTQDEVIPGNNGLKDQLLAIKWARDNIALFGGDPSKITIFGQSAGGGSCAYHLLNKNSTGLLNGVIIESGTFLCPGMFQRKSRAIAFGTGAILDPTFEDSEDSQALYELLVSVDADELNDAASQYDKNTKTAWDNFVEVGSVFAPVIEPENPDAFLTEKMYVLLKEGNVLPVPTMMGFCAEEKAGQSEDGITSIATTLDEHLEYIVSADMQITDLDARKEMGEKIREIYTGGEPFVEHLGAAIRYGSDNFLGRSMIKHAELFSSLANTFFYQFSFDGNLGPGGPDGPGGPPTTRASGLGDGAGTVGHGSELNYLFCSGDSCYDDSYSEGDLLTRRRMIQLWTNFAKYQNPTPDASELLQNVTWPNVDVTDGDFFYLNIGEDLEVLNHPKEETYQKWVELYDSLGYDDFDTY